MVMTLKEKDLKQRLAIKVQHPLGLINYRALEETIKGIEVEIEREITNGRRELLFKIRRDVRKILNEL